jgi:hypothetical protein
LLVNNSVKTFPRKRRIVGGVVLYAIRVVLKESRRLVLPITFLFKILLISLHLCLDNMDTRKRQEILTLEYRFTVSHRHFYIKNTASIDIPRIYGPNYRSESCNRTHKLLLLLRRKYFQFSSFHIAFILLISFFHSQYSNTIYFTYLMIDIVSDLWQEMSSLRQFKNAQTIINSGKGLNFSSLYTISVRYR